MLLVSDTFIFPILAYKYIHITLNILPGLKKSFTYIEEAQGMKDYSRGKKFR